MAQDFNNFSFIGRLVTDLDITPSTDSREGYARARMATNGWKDEQTLWLGVFFPERVIGRIHEYVKKGTPLAVTGRLSQSNYTDKEGNQQMGLTVNATSVDFIGGPRNNEETTEGTTTGRMSTKNANRSNTPQDDTEDLPF